MAQANSTGGEQLRHVTAFEGGMIVANRTMFWAFLTLLAMAGCGADAPVENQAAPVIKTEIAEVDPKVVEFKKKVREYLDEVRVGRKLITSNPTLEQLRTKMDLITDLYTRLPEIPPGVDVDGTIAAQLGYLADYFKDALVFTRKYYEALAYKGDYKDYGEVITKSGRDKVVEAIGTSLGILQAWLDQ